MVTSVTNDCEAVYRLESETATVCNRVVNVAESLFGFDRRYVVPLESAEQPWHYCMFEVLGVQYQVRDGRISIYGQGE